MIYIYIYILFTDLLQVGVWTDPRYGVWLLEYGDPRTNSHQMNQWVSIFGRLSFARESLGGHTHPHENITAISKAYTGHFRRLKRHVRVTLRQRLLPKQSKVSSPCPQPAAFARKLGEQAVGSGPCPGQLGESISNNLCMEYTHYFEVIL